MRMGRSLSALIVVLTATCASAVVHGQIKPGEQQTPVLSADEASVQPQRVETVEPEQLTIGGGPTEQGFDADELTADTLRARVEAELDEAKRRTLRFETAFEEVQRDFVEGTPGEEAAVSDEVLGRFERDVDRLHVRFTRIERGYARLGDTDKVEHARQALGALDTLSGQLALLGLRLEKRGERARVANALEFDFKLLIKALDALHGPVLIDGRRASERIIRPPEGVKPSGELIRPPEGVAPSQRIIRPPEGIKPSQRIIRPPTSDNPAVND